jgi:hypothetical protein
LVSSVLLVERPTQSTRRTGVTRRVRQPRVKSAATTTSRRYERSNRVASSLGNRLVKSAGQPRRVDSGSMKRDATPQR